MIRMMTMINSNTNQSQNNHDIEQLRAQLSDVEKDLEDSIAIRNSLQSKMAAMEEERSGILEDLSAQTNVADQYLRQVKQLNSQLSDYRQQGTCSRTF